jgi:hypothetical protein
MQKKATDMVRNDQLTLQKAEDLTMYTETVKLIVTKTWIKLVLKNLGWKQKN